MDFCNYGPFYYTKEVDKLQASATWLVPSIQHSLFIIGQALYYVLGIQKEIKYSPCSQAQNSNTSLPSRCSTDSVVAACIFTAELRD